MVAEHLFAAHRDGLTRYLTRVVGHPDTARDLALEPHRLDSLASSVLTVRLLIAVALVIITSAAGLLFFPRTDGVVIAFYSLTLLAVGAGTRWIFLGLENTSPVALARSWPTRSTRKSMHCDGVQLPR